MDKKGNLSRWHVSNRDDDAHQGDRAKKITRCPPLWSSSKKVFTARINHWPSHRHFSITVARVASLHWHFQRRGRKAECLPVRMKSLHACQLARDEHLSTKLRLPNTSRISTSAAMHEAAFNVMIHQEATKITQWLSLVNFFTNIKLIGVFCL